MADHFLPVKNTNSSVHVAKHMITLLIIYSKELYKSYLPRLLSRVKRKYLGVIETVHMESGKVIPVVSSRAKPNT